LESGIDKSELWIRQQETGYRSGLAWKMNEALLEQETGSRVPLFQACHWKPSSIPRRVALLGVFYGGFSQHRQTPTIYYRQGRNRSLLIDASIAKRFRCQYQRAYGFVEPGPPSECGANGLPFEKELLGVCSRTNTGQGPFLLETAAHPLCLENPFTPRCELKPWCCSQQAVWRPATHCPSWCWLSGSRTSRHPPSPMSKRHGVQCQRSSLCPQLSVVQLQPSLRISGA
jgi:hypothetical protein